MKNNNEANTNHQKSSEHCPNCHHGHGEKETTSHNAHEDLYETLAQDAWFPDFYATDEYDNSAEDFFEDDTKIYNP